MKHVACTAAILFAVLGAQAQSPLQSTNTEISYDFPVVSGKGVLGVPIYFSSFPSTVSHHGLLVLITGPNSTLCQFQLEQSVDGVTWQPYSDSYTCVIAGASIISLTNLANPFLRINVTGFVPALDLPTNTSSTVRFHYFRHAE